MSVMKDLLDNLMNTLDELDNPDITEKELEKLSIVAANKNKLAKNVTDIMSLSLDAQKQFDEYHAGRNADGMNLFLGNEDM